MRDALNHVLDNAGGVEFNVKLSECKVNRSHALLLFKCHGYAPHI